MSTTTPSAGPAPIEFTRERYLQLIAEGATMALGSTMRLPTREHLVAMHHALQKAAATRDQMTAIVAALLLDNGQRTVTIPNEILADVAVSGHRVGIDTSTPGYTQVAVLGPPTPAGVGKPS